MYVFENPVLQRELLVNLRKNSGFLLLLLYQALLAAVVYFAWPQQARLQANAEAAKQLVNLFFLGQYVLASMMAPSFAAGTVTGEKERKTYEMLLASPLKPAAIVLGKLVASLSHLAILMFASLPIVMLCLPLGGVSIYEVLAAYLGLVLSVITFGMISVACSSYFQRTASSLVVSYLLILPLAILGALTWRSLEGSGEFRLFLTVTVLPLISILICAFLFYQTQRRMLHPPDVGSEGKEVVDLETEAQEVVGLVIQRDQFPDRLFAPPKRVDLLDDDSNPVYEKEVHSEIFSQGTLMLRLVIQISMFLAIPIMAVYLFMKPGYSWVYICYVVVFNVLVGPVFSAGSVTSERERQTLDMLLTTTITPWQILWGKLIAGFRVSSVLTLFLVWPLVLAVIFGWSFYWKNLPGVFAFTMIILMTCITTAIVALFCSVMFRKTSVSMMTTYAVLILLFCAPPAVGFFADNYFKDWKVSVVDRSVPEVVATLGAFSPFVVSESIPLKGDGLDYGSSRTNEQIRDRTWTLFIGYVILNVLVNATLFAIMIALFNSRWRVAQ